MPAWSLPSDRYRAPVGQEPSLGLSRIVACARGSGHANFSVKALSPGVTRCWVTSKVIPERACRGEPFQLLSSGPRPPRHTHTHAISTSKGEIKKSI